MLSLEKKNEILSREVVAKDELEAIVVKFSRTAGEEGEIGKRDFKELVLQILREEGEVDMPTEDQLETAFKLADEDHSNMVDIEEFVEIFEKLKNGQVEGIAVHQIVAEGVLNQEDLNHLRKAFQSHSTQNISTNVTSLNRGITYKQFARLIKELMIEQGGHKPSNSELHAAFLIADVDGGGTVDEEEFIDLYRMVKKGEVKGLTIDKNVPTNFDEFLNKDKTRTDLLSKGDQSMFQILMHWSGTLPREVLSQYNTYIPFVIFVFVYVMQDSEYTSFFVVSGTDAANALKGVDVLVAILLVSLFQQGFDRYYQVYFTMCKCRTATISFVGMARAYIDDDIIVQALSRYSNLANVANFIGITPVYTKGNFYDPLTKKHHLLTPRERFLIDEKVGRDSKGAVNDIFVWLNTTLQLACDRGQLSVFEKNDLNATLLEQHEALISVWNWADQPLPFAYVNLVITVATLYTFLYGGLKALQAVEANQFTLPFLVVLIITLSMLSLIRICLMLSAPFSHDDWALRVTSMCSSTINHSNLMTLSRHKDVIKMLYPEETGHAVTSEDEILLKNLHQYILDSDGSTTESGSLHQSVSHRSGLVNHDDDNNSGDLTYDNDDYGRNVGLHNAGIEENKDSDVDSSTSFPSVRRRNGGGKKPALEF